MADAPDNNGRGDEAVVDRLARIEGLLVAIARAARTKWIGVREFAALLGVHPVTVRRRIARGALDVQRLGRRVLVRAPDPLVDDFGGSPKSTEASPNHQQERRVCQDAASQEDGGGSADPRRKD